MKNNLVFSIAPAESSVLSSVTEITMLQKYKQTRNDIHAWWTFLTTQTVADTTAFIKRRMAIEEIVRDYKKKLSLQNQDQEVCE